MYKQHIMTKDSIIVITDEGTFTVHKSNKDFLNVKLCLHNKDYNKLPDLVDARGKVERSSKGLVKITKDNKVFIKGNNVEMPHRLATKVMEFVAGGVDLTPIVKFWDNLRRNPNLESRNDLYTFIEQNRITITPDGCFIAYKAVKDDFTDCRTGTFDNHPGKTVKMPREACNHDRNVDCSFGLHVCAWGYLEQEFTSNRTIVEVLVNPRHVVSVPIDYNFKKMRCCEYTVLNRFQKGEDKVLDELVLTSRTYYYKGRKDNKSFDVRRVTSHRPSRFVETCRAHTTEEATKKLQKLMLVEAE